MGIIDPIKLALDRYGLASVSDAHGYNPSVDVGSEDIWTGCGNFNRY